MQDIETRKDIEELMTDFYHKALSDNLIGYIFTDVAKIDLEHHLPIITDFWEMLLFGTVNFQMKYGRSPMQVHQVLSEKTPLRAEHFGRWVKLFCETVDARFAGDTADLAKIRAVSIAETMRLKFSSKTSAGVPVVRG
ncbi:MAG TPA: group III truncated hemoglobin [Pyrinomonadaceae bacterium]|nr:group III truncated hemoglobin [Pyrinomonadaceae bacterium]